MTKVDQFGLWPQSAATLDALLCIQIELPAFLELESAIKTHRHNHECDCPEPDEVIVNEIVAFIDVAEERASKPFNRFADLSALDMVDLNFKFVFHIALHRRLASASHSPVKSAF